MPRCNARLPAGGCCTGKWCDWAWDGARPGFGFRCQGSCCCHGPLASSAIARPGSCRRTGQDGTGTRRRPCPRGSQPSPPLPSPTHTTEPTLQLRDLGPDQGDHHEADILIRRRRQLLAARRVGGPHELAAGAGRGVGRVGARSSSGSSGRRASWAAVVCCTAHTRSLPHATPPPPPPPPPCRSSPAPAAST